MTRAAIPIPALIAVCPIVTHSLASGRGVSGHAQKAVLLVLWQIGGWPTTLETVAERCGASKTTAWRAIEALIDQGLVTRGVERESQRYVWTIEEAKLQSVASQHVARLRLANR